MEQQRLTRRDQRHPCPQAASPSTCRRISTGAHGRVEVIGAAYLEVISKVVPKIWARMNSAIVKYVQNGNANAKRGKEQSRQELEMGMSRLFAISRQRIAVCWK